MSDKHGTLSGINVMKFIKQFLAKPGKAIRNVIAKRAVKKLVKVISKNNPYALAAVELYGLYDMINSKRNKVIEDNKDKKDGKE